MRGHGSGPPTVNKWSLINTLLKEKQLAILALQETHLTQTQAQTRTLIPGQAILLTVPWHNNRTLTILNIYAPNIAMENKEFWQTLEHKWTHQHLPNPDVMLGDFNIVEDALDCIPSHVDNAEAVDALFDLKLHLQLLDGWRATHTTEKKFSYLQTSTGSQSRIDRIYTTDQILQSAENWTIESTGVPTDHKLTTVRIADPAAPYIGKESEIKSLPTRSLQRNPQTLFKKYKDNLQIYARKHARTLTPKLISKIKTLQTDLDKTLNQPITNISD
ncbi:Endonuclease/exonuclease/phosphatase [Sparassis latifolia]